MGKGFLTWYDNEGIAFPMKLNLRLEKYPSIGSSVEHAVMLCGLDTDKLRLEEVQIKNNLPDGSLLVELGDKDLIVPECLLEGVPRKYKTRTTADILAYLKEQGMSKREIVYVTEENVRDRVKMISSLVGVDKSKALRELVILLIEIPLVHFVKMDSNRKIKGLLAPISHYHVDGFSISDLTSVYRSVREKDLVAVNYIDKHNFDIVLTPDGYLKDTTLHVNFDYVTANKSRRSLVI